MCVCEVSWRGKKIEVEIEKVKKERARERERERERDRVEEMIRNELEGKEKEGR